MEKKSIKKLIVSPDKYKKITSIMLPKIDVNNVYQVNMKEWSISISDHAKQRIRERLKEEVKEILTEDYLDKWTYWQLEHIGPKAITKVVCEQKINNPARITIIYMDYRWIIEVSPRRKNICLITMIKKE